MSRGVELTLAEWAPSYKRATSTQAPLAAIGFACAVVARIAGSSVWWLVGGVLLGLSVPFTLLVVMPTNRRLSSGSGKDPVDVRRLLDRWNRLHAVRTIASFLAPLVFLIAH
jgi:hypothetical protein